MLQDLILPFTPTTTTDSACKKGRPNTVSSIGRSHRWRELTGALAGETGACAHTARGINKIAAIINFSGIPFFLNNLPEFEIILFIYPLDPLLDFGKPCISHILARINCCTGIIIAAAKTAANQLKHAFIIIKIVVNPCK